MAIITDKKTNAFIETECIFKHEGKSFESGGSWLCVNKKTGKLQGILYQHKDEQTGKYYIGSWNNSIKIPAHFGQIFRSNWNIKRQYCWFTYQGKNFIGINNNVDWQDCISVREIK